MKRNFLPLVSDMTEEQLSRFNAVNNYSYSRMILNQRLDAVHNISTSDIFFINSLLVEFISKLDSHLNTYSDEKQNTLG